MRCERLLLTRLCRSDLPPPGEVSRLFSARPDCRSLITLAGKHECLPQLFKALDRPEAEKAVSRPYLDSLRNHYFCNLKRNLLYEEAVADILSRAPDGLLAFKGLALILSVYKDPALRVMSDVDLLARKKDLARFHETLTAAGFRKKPSRHEEEEAYYSKNAAEQTLAIELHTHVVPARPCPVLPSLWERAAQASLKGRAILIPSPEDSLLIAALHIRRHTRRLTLKFLIDLHELLLAFPQMDWDYILRASTESRMRNCLYLALALTSELFGEAVPPALKAVKPGGISPLLKNFITPRTVFDSCPARGYLLRAALFDSFKDAASSARKMLRIRQRTQQ